MILSLSIIKFIKKIASILSILLDTELFIKTPTGVNNILHFQSFDIWFHTYQTSDKKLILYMHLKWYEY